MAQAVTFRAFGASTAFLGQFAEAWENILFRSFLDFGREGSSDTRLIHSLFPLWFAEAHLYIPTDLQVNLYPQSDLWY